MYTVADTQVFMNLSSNKDVNIYLTNDIIS